MNYPVNGYSQTQAWKYQLALYAQQNPFAAQAMAPLLSPLFNQDSAWRGAGNQNWQMPQQYQSPSAYMPQPNIQFSGAPAGQGLKTNPGQGWPENAIQTAGGYTILPEGGTSWKIFDKNAKPGDQPMTTVSGDPHVYEKDGGRWDFTKDSNFRLPDGTNIAVNTSSESGYSVTTGLDITNGADHINVTGIDGTVKVGQNTGDGFIARAQISNTQDTFHLGGNGGGDVKWFKESGGVMQGEVTGAHMDGTTNRYEQNVNKDSQYFVDPSLRPQIGSDAWGNQLRMEAVDIARRSGNPGYAQQMGQLMEADDVHGKLVGALGYDPLQFGGYGQFGGFQQQTYSVGQLFGLLQYQEAMNQWSASARQNQLFG